MILRHISFILIAFVCFAQTAYANGGSLYSRFALGEMQYSISPQASGMGGAGLAAGSKMYINTVNPALLSEIEQTRVLGQVNFATHALESDYSSATQTEGNFGGTAMAIPISRFVVSVGLVPYSSLNYDQIESGTITSTDNEEISYQSSFDGTGGLSAIPIALGFNLFESEKIGTFALGAAYTFLFGTFEKTTSTTYSDLTYEATDEYSRDNLNGSNFTIGLSYKTNEGVFGNNDQFYLGGFYTSKTSLDADRELLISSSVGTDTISTSSGNKARLPEQFGMGMAYRFNSRFIMALDYRKQKFSNMTYLNEDVSYRKDASRIGGGIEYSPKYERRSGFFQKLTYRAGAYVLNHNLKLNNEDINEYGLTFGFGVPLSDGNSMIGINMEYALKGTTDAQLIQENIFRVKISMSAGDTWFLQPIIQ